MGKISTPPKMGNNGGTAFVRINGKRIYLGKYGSQEAAQNYARYIAEWSVSPSSILPIGKCTVDTLAVAFLDYAKANHYPSDYSNYKIALQILLNTYSGYSVELFSPKCLRTVQEQCTKRKSKYGKPYSRQYCNKLTNCIKTVFRWGVAQELVPASVAEALKFVPALRQGKTTAPETIPRLDVPDEVMRTTLPHLLPTIAAMVQVQREACMRPNEVCRMQVGDIDRSGEIWMYCPAKHKNTWRGHKKIITLGKPEQELIAPRLIGKTPEQAVFSPKDAIRERWEHNTIHRKIKRTPSMIKRHEHRMNQYERKFYTVNAYGKAIERSITNANLTLPDDQKIPYWTPYQLRHASITELSMKYGRDVARAVAGHKTVDVTKGYDHSDVKIAIRVAKKRSKKK
jgi:integrase